MGSRYNAPFMYSDTKIIHSFRQPSVADDTTGRITVESSTSPLTCTAFSHLLPCWILNPSITAAEWPAALQQIDMSGERYVDAHPQMLDPLSFVRIPRRRALIVRDHQNTIIRGFSYTVPKIGINYNRHPDPQFRLKSCNVDAYGMTNFLLCNALLHSTSEFL